MQPEHCSGIRACDCYLPWLSKHLSDVDANGWLGRSFCCRHDVNIALPDMPVLRGIPGRTRERIGDGLAYANDEAFMAAVFVGRNPTKRAFDELVRAGATSWPEIDPG